MLVRTYAKEKPASVWQHPAGKWWNFARVPSIVYTGFALVSNAQYSRSRSSEPRANLQSSTIEKAGGGDQGEDNAKAKTGAEAKLQSLAESESPAPDHPEIKPTVIEVEASAASQPTVQIPDPTIIVEGDGVLGQCLIQWQGVARVGLIPVARRLGLDEIQVLIHEDQDQSTLMAYWPGGETTLSCHINGRAGQMRAVRELVQQIRTVA